MNTTPGFGGCRRGVNVQGSDTWMPPREQCEHVVGFVCFTLEYMATKGFQRLGVWRNHSLLEHSGEQKMGEASNLFIY